MFEVYFPHKSPQWQEIRRKLIELAACRDIIHLVRHLDFIEHLVNLQNSTYTPFLQLLPSRETFIGLGNYLFDFTSERRRNKIFSTLIPKIIELALSIESCEPLSYSKSFQDFHVSLSRKHAASLIASSFLCLFPCNKQEQQFLLNEPNFTYFYRCIGSRPSSQADRLECLLDYFDRHDNSDDSHFKLTRRFFKSMQEKAFPRGPRMVQALLTHQLPMVLVEHIMTSEEVAETYGLPMVNFANAYVGGGALRATASPAAATTQDSIFFRYPETLVSLTLCCRLEGPEAVWMDAFLGPYGVSGGEEEAEEKVVGGGGVDPRDDEGRRRRRRIVVANSTRFPDWASELQYSEACLVGDVIKTAAAFYQVDQEGVSGGEEASASEPFSESWWREREVVLVDEKDTGYNNPCPRRFPPPENGRGGSDLEGVAMNHELQAIIALADRLSGAILGDGLRCQQSKSPPQTTPVTSLSGRKVDGLEERPINCRGYKSTLVPQIPSGVPRSLLQDFAEEITAEIMEEVRIVDAERVRCVVGFADTLSWSLLQGCLRPEAPTDDRPSRPTLRPSRHKKSQRNPPRNPPKKVRAPKPPQQICFTEKLRLFVESLTSRSMLAAMEQLRSSSVGGCGLVSTTAYDHGNKGDAQVSVLTQWIAAAAVSHRNSYISPLVFTTSRNEQLSRLHTLIECIQSAKWSAGHLLQALLDYSEYRSISPTQTLPIFDYIFSRFCNTTVAI